MTSNKKRTASIFCLVSLTLLMVITISLKKSLPLNNLNQTSGAPNQITSASASLTSSDESLDKELLNYIKGISTFSAVNVADAKQMISNNQRFILYTGRATCEWCRKLVPTLCTVAQNKNLTIYYLDSENTTTDDSLQTFRNSYGIDTVPSVICFYDDSQYYSLKLDITSDDFSDALLEEELLKHIEH